MKQLYDTVKQARIFSCILLSMLFLWSGQANAGKALEATTDQVKELLSSGQDVLVLDIRTPEEFTGGHLPGAINADFMSKGFEGEVVKLAELAKDKPVVVYCRTGRRSLQSLGTIEQHFQGTIYHMFQGIVGWSGNIEK